MLLSCIKVIENAIVWLDKWEKEVKEGLLTKEDFLTPITAEGLRVTLHSMADLSIELIENYGFQYLLSGRVNQDSLEVY